MAASQGYYGPLAGLPDEPIPPDGIGEACDSHTPRLITGASAIEEMAMGGGAAPPPPRVREMHPLGMARAMRAPLAHSFERSDVPPAPRSLEEVIGAYAWGREIIEDAEDGEEGEESEEGSETFMVINEEVVRPPPTPQRPLPTRDARRTGQPDCPRLLLLCLAPAPHAPRRDGKRSSRAPRSYFLCEKHVPRS